MAGATAPIQLLAWEPPYAASAALKDKKGQKKKVLLELEKEMLKGRGRGTSLNMHLQAFERLPCRVSIGIVLHSPRN